MRAHVLKEFFERQRKTQNAKRPTATQSKGVSQDLLQFRILNTLWDRREEHPPAGDLIMIQLYLVLGIHVLCLSQLLFLGMSIELI